MFTSRSFIRRTAITVALAASSLPASAVELLNASYDVTREFYKEYNAAFIAHWKTKTGEDITVKQSHGGSSKQVRSVIDGLQADVVTMNQALDIDQLVKPGLIPANWSSRLPKDSVPYTSTIFFIVRKGNPKKIKDWSDLVRDDVKSIIPNPKTSGNGRYSYLAAWGYALRQPGGDEAKAREFVKKLFANVPVLDAGGRGATTSFAKNGIGDVLLTFENEVSLTIREFADEGFELVVPTTSILAENPVVWVDKVVKKKKTEALAKAYLEYLYSPEAQEIAAKQNFRPGDPAVFAKHAAQFPNIPLFSVAEVFGGWTKAQQVHFADGGVFDQIYEKR
ncbi:MAG: sulfate ABC transporter substrate-binding protein [Nibricoccus sp.]